ncbi:MAG: transglycosylase domain-containing protein [Clostridia bacterium]|nr:transglycosylase domain-containing protein [Clostridia bacterium]
MATNTENPMVDPVIVDEGVSSDGATKRFDRKNNKSEKKHNTRAFVQRKRPRSTLLAILFTVIKIFIVVAIVGVFAIFGFFLGIAKAYVDTSPSLDISALTVNARTSYIYDRNGDMITTYAGMEYRDWASIEEFPEMLKNALISIEDVRFYEHGGLDFKRLFSAVVNTFMNSRTHGGSTITQQLIKKKVLSNIQSYKRKIQEAYLAYELEHELPKDKILEAYMNDVYLGDSNYGFKTAAKDYFGKELNELTIRECAMLAGMVQKPNVTNPRANTYKRFYEDGTNKMDVTNNRTDTVLEAMRNQNKISLEEYEQALSEEVTILEVSEQKQLYDMAYFVEYGIRDVVTHMLKQRGLDDNNSNRNAIEKELRTGGYHIYLTVDPSIQQSVQNIITEWENYPALRNSNASELTDPTSGITSAQPQAASVIIDQHTGEIIAMIGGREEPVQKLQFNRAYKSYMPVGSSIKPLSVFGPALDIGLTPGTYILNSEIPIDGYGGERGYPKIGSRRYEGLVSMRVGVEESLNIVAARVLFDSVKLERSAKYLELLGIDRSRINVDGPGLALGTSGISPLQLSAAYACIANGGMYLEPLSFSYVVSDDGQVILDASKVRETHRVFSETTAYMLTDMMRDVVEHGTGTNAQIPGIAVAGKTGTNEDYTSVCFAGFTGYYTASLWIGHDKYAEKLATGSTGGSSAAPLWQAFMSVIHRGYSNRPLIDVSPVELGLVKAAICPVSGKLATDDCMGDTYNTPIYDWCREDQLPSGYCDMHCLVDYCSASNTFAGPECTGSSRYQKCFVLIRSDSVYNSLEDEKLYSYIPNAIRSDLSPTAFMAAVMRGPSACTVHGGGGGGGHSDSVDSLIAQANELMETVRNYLDNVQTLPLIDRALLEGGIIQLREAVWSRDASRITRYLSELRRNYTILSSQYPPPPSYTVPPIVPGTPVPETNQPIVTRMPSPSPEPTPAPTPMPTSPVNPPIFP